MEKSFEPAAIEARWYPQWEAAGVFKPSGVGTPYAIMLPPPNVTGTLHMGHAFQHTLMDTLIRYHRMRGFDTLWQVGTDHAGIATEMVVNRNLAQAGKGETRDSLGRDAFIEKVWEWKQESGDTITRQMRRMGASADWSRERFTMDEGLSTAVTETFVRLHEQGLIYRGQRLVNWDPVLKTAISDLEVVSEEEDGFLWSIRYPLANGETYEHVETDAEGNETRESRDYLVVATTRPETMLGDTAVMVHPEDERYVHLIGKSVHLPLCDREIPIISDDYVDRAFGTGVVKVTPAHDFNDYAVGQRHSLPMINILTPDAAINDAAPERFRAIDRYDARKAVLAELTELELLVEAKPHKLQVPRGDRTGQVIEPYLTFQWFVKMDELGARGLALVENGDVRFVPPSWINTYRHWMANIQDWCISRQLWWGHRIPAWFDADGNVFVARTEEEAYRRAGLGPAVVDAAIDQHGGSRPTLRRDEDVLETWFSSALWSHSTLGWPNAEAMQQNGFDRYLPTSVLVTGFDIIFFWVARMIMMTDHFTGQVPFKDVYITGLVRDSQGQKMSKSKGNVLDPIDLIDGISLDELVAKRTSGLMQPQMAAKIEKATRKEFPDGIPAFGADALRFTFASLASHGRDIKFDLNRCEGYKNFCNKLWNAARFVLMNCEDFSAASASRGPRDDVPLINPSRPIEHWIVAELNTAIQLVETHLADYRFDLASQAIYDFAWNSYCDWFIEFAKPVLNGNDADARRSVQQHLIGVLDATLRLLHPLAPFVTEEIWQSLKPLTGESRRFISDTPFPTTSACDSSEGDKADLLKKVVTALRRVRSELGLAPAKQAELFIKGSTAVLRNRVAEFSSEVEFLTRCTLKGTLGDAETPPASAVAALDNGMSLYVSLAGLVDLDAERVRLDKELKRISSEIAKCEGKLASETFVANAPPAVVAQERQRLGDWSAQQAVLREQRDLLS